MSPHADEERATPELPAHDHRWQPGPVVEWTQTRGGEAMVGINYMTGTSARSMVVLCPCGEWRIVPLAGRYHGWVPQR